MSDATNDTTSQLDTSNEILKELFPGLIYEKLTVDNTSAFTPYGGESSVFVLINDWSDPDYVPQVVAIAEILDDHTLLVGRRLP